MLSLQEQFGPIDIYLFDQLLRSRITPGMRILDAGCGGGRNLVYLLREGYDVFGVDTDLQAVASLPRKNFRHEAVEAMSFPDAFFDVIISSAVLHFARDSGHFNAMLHEMWRTLKPNGFLFCRLASLIGIEHLVVPLNGRHYLLPDGSERYLVDQALLLDLTSQLQAELLDPIKTTVVQNQRSMTTWVLYKPIR